MLIDIPAGTAVKMNGIPVTFPKVTKIDFPCETIAHAAELCAAAHISIDLSYTTVEDGKMWRVYQGAAGKMFREEIVPEAPKTKAKAKAKK